MPGIDQRTLRVMWTACLFFLAAGILYLIRQTLVVFVLALFVAHLLDPLVSWVASLTRRRMGRTAALALVYLAMLALILVTVIPIGGRIGEEAAGLATRLPQAIQADPLSHFPLPSWLEDIRPKLTQVLRDRLEDLDQQVLPLLSRAGTQIVSGLGNVLSVILIPILSFFLLKDGAAMRRTVINFFQGTTRTLAEGILADLHTMLVNYLRALVLLSIATFVAFSGYFSLIGAPYVILLAGIAAILELIPVAGPLAAAVVILLVTAFSGFPHVLWLAMFLVIYRIFQDYVLNPYLLGSGVQMHPLLVLFGVLAGEQIAGIPGMFFSAPALAAVRVIYVRAREHRDATS
jgi:predicted PurR-regulated permease PerM